MGRCQKGRISPAALFRSIDAWQPTLLIDEVDACLKDNEELRGLINCGHTRESAFVIRCVGDDYTPTKFNVWGAKLLAGIGHVAETLMDRSIIFELRRKLQHEIVERLRQAEAGLFDELRSKLARFSEDYSEQVKNARPALPESLNDRAQDNWEPLLAIAMTAGDEWYKLATETAIALSGIESTSKSAGIELLSDIKEIFKLHPTDSVSTFDLINYLIADPEKRWASYNKVAPINSRQINNLLQAYGIHSKSIRIGDSTPKGFHKEWFQDVFSRYLDEKPTQTPQVTIDEGLAVADTKNNPQQSQDIRNSATDCGGIIRNVADEISTAATETITTHDGENNYVSSVLTPKAITDVNQLLSKW